MELFQFIFVVDNDDERWLSLAGGRVRDVIDEEEDDQGLTVVIDLSSLGDEGKKEKKRRRI